MPWPSCSRAPAALRRATVCDCERGGESSCLDPFIVRVGIVEPAIAADFVPLAEATDRGRMRLALVTFPTIVGLLAIGHGRLLGAAFLITKIILASKERLAVVLRFENKPRQEHARRLDVATRALSDHHAIAQQFDPCRDAPLVARQFALLVARNRGDPDFIERLRVGLVIAP